MLGSAPPPDPLLELRNRLNMLKKFLQQLDAPDLRNHPGELERELEFQLQNANVMIAYVAQLEQERQEEKRRRLEEQRMRVLPPTNADPASKPANDNPRPDPGERARMVVQEFHAAKRLSSLLSSVELDRFVETKGMALSLAERGLKEMASIATTIRDEGIFDELDMLPLVNSSFFPRKGLLGQKDPIRR